jgi:hypothetical protein
MKPLIYAFSLWIGTAGLMAEMSDQEVQKAQKLFAYAFEVHSSYGIDHRRIQGLREEERSLLVRYLYHNIEKDRSRGEPEHNLASGPRVRHLAMLDDDWGLQTFVAEVRNEAGANWDGSFRLVGNAKVIPLIGDLLFVNGEYRLAGDVGYAPPQWTASRAVIETLKYSPQFLPDMGIWAKQLEDAWSKPGGDVIKILREWYKENEQKLREGKFQEIRPGRVPVVTADPNEVPRAHGIDQPEKGPPQGVQQPLAPNAVAQGPEVSAWALWGAGGLAILLALGLGFRGVFSSR